MFLESLKLQNFRCFENIDIRFPNRVTALTGDNGAGKSAVLESCAIAAGSFTANLNKKAKCEIKHSDIPVKFNKSIPFPTRIQVSGTLENRQIIWAKELSSSTGRNRITGYFDFDDVINGYRSRAESGDNYLILPVVAYYGVERFSTKNNKNTVLSDLKRTDGYNDCFSGDDKLLKQCIQFFDFESIYIDRGEWDTAFKTAKRAVEYFVSMITGLQEISLGYRSDIDEYGFSYNNGFMSLSMMSTGYKTIISMVADTAFRMALLNPQLGNLVLIKTPGIVIVDEIDLHLHPKYQRIIIDKLKDLFPEVQFVLSTSSPLIINTVKNSSVLILKDNTILQTDNQTYGRDSDTILREVFGISSRPDYINKMFKEFYDKLDKRDFHGAEEVIEALERLIGDNDPQLSDIRMSLELERIWG